MNNISRSACSKCRENQNHTNTFITLNGIPYLVAEYMDNRALLPIDAANVKSEINIDQSNCMQTIIDISIDDIGHKSTGALNIIGNKTKLDSLHTIIRNRTDMLDNQLPVLRRGIVLQVNYQLENQRTGQVIRSMVENLRIYDRSFFIAVNRDDINDNGIVVNFSNSMVSTVNNFTNGLDPMILRITSIQMFYERVKRSSMAPRVPKSLITDPELAQYFYGYDANLYKYHQRMQSQHIMSSGTGNEILDSGIPGSWGIFDRFYHFDTESKDIVIHDQEVYDQRTPLIKVPCGSVVVGRSFVVNPGTRLVFKICIWKNDLIAVNDCNGIADLLRAPISSYQPKPQPPRFCCPMQIQAQENTPTNTDYEQNAAINEIAASLSDLINTVNSLCDSDNGGSDHTIPALPERPMNPPYPDSESESNCPGCVPPPIPFPIPQPDRRFIIGKLAKKVKELQDAIQALEQNDLQSFPIDLIKELVQQAADATDGIDDDNSDPVNDTDINNEP